jgi:hypothetical protein
LVSDEPFGDARGFDCGCQIHIDVYTAIGEQVHQILGSNIAARTGREWATAQSTNRGIESRHSS